MINRQLIKDDFYEAINGDWIKTAVIPSDKPTTGGFQDLVEKTEKTLMKDFENLKNPSDPLMNEFIKFYNATKNMELRNSQGFSGIKPFIEKIESIKDFKDFEKLSISFIKSGLVTPFSFSVYSDMSDATINVLYLSPCNTILPDKTYYGTEKGTQLLDKFSEMLEKLLKLYGYDEKSSKKIVNDTLEFDKLVYPHTRTSEQRADYTKVNNPRTFDEVCGYTNVISFSNIITSLINAKPKKIIVEEPEFYENYNKILNNDSLELLKSWLISSTLTASSKILTEDFRQTGGMYKRFISGIDSEMSIDKYAYYFATGVFSEVISVYYGEKYFGNDAKKDVITMIKSMIQIYRERLEKNSWLDSKTINSAIKKLDTLEILVGYPDKYDDIYTKLIFNENLTYFENVINFDSILTELHFSKWNQPVDRKKWHMSSNTVNAYYSPSNNLICFPAAILQAPFYSYTQTKSENYGGIGTVIGHEISHAFDNNGSQFDENGNMNNWWTEKDYETFNNLAKAMIDQFEGIPFASGNVNGTLTVSENIADAGGLSCSLEALKRNSDYSLEEFFINYAKIWCRKAKLEYKDLLLKTDVHAPAELRVNVQVKNLAEFYEAFDIKEEDKMYLEKDKRVNIW